MAGLLDAQDAALMALGTGLLGGGTFAQALGRGGQGFLSTYAAMAQAQQEKALKERELAMQEELRKAQIQDYLSQAEQRKAQANELARKQKQAEALQQAIPGLFRSQSAPTVPGDAYMPGAPPEQRMTFDALGAAALGMPPEAIKQYHGLTQLDTPEVARTIDVDDGKGGKATMQVDKFGRPVGQAMPAYIAPHFQNFGGNTGVFRGSNQIGNFANTQTPDSIANNQVTIRGQNMVDARARDANKISAEGNVIKAETEVRKEFNDLPEVKNYKMAFPAYKAISEAATRSNPQADISLIYGLAKLYDPTSVVREGEYNTIANSQAIPEWLKGQAQAVMGGGRLTPETKRQIMTEATGRVVTYQTEFEKARKTYESVVKDRGGDPAKVFTPVGEKVNQPKTIKQTGTYNGRKVIQYSDGSIEYAN